MSNVKITAELLRQMVGVRAGQRPLIDKLVDPLNLVLPAYGITTEYRIAGFLATCAPESDWFKTLREYGKGRGRKYGRAINGLVYYGRGIFQVTWIDNYRKFTKYVADNWETIKPRALVYKWTVPPDFVAEPELLATPYWAVEAACWYWKANNLAKYADRGLKGFFGLQGLVNRGSAEKKALHYDARLSSYETARRVIPDDFNLTSATASPRPEEPDPADGSSSSDQAKPAGDQPPSLSDGSNAPPPPSEGSAVVPKGDAEVAKPGFFKSIYLKITGGLGSIGGVDQATSYAQSAQAFGLSAEFWEKVFYGIAILIALWLGYEIWKYFWCPIAARRRTDALIDANKTLTNHVFAVKPEDLAAYEAAGWVAVRRN